MAKVTMPLLSVEARGELAKALIYQQQRYGGSIVKGYAIPRDPRSTAQAQQRTYYQTAKNAWNALSAAEKLVWVQRAKRLHLLGYNLFLRENIGPAYWIIGQGVIGSVKIS